MYNKQQKLKRSDVPERYKWQLGHIYQDNFSWELDITQVKELAKSVFSYKGKLSKSSKTLVECLATRSKMWEVYEKVYEYAHMKNQEDYTNPKNQALIDTVDILHSIVSNAESYILLEILGISSAKLNSFLNENPELHFYKSFLYEKIKQKSHVISSKKEEILALTHHIKGIPFNVFNKLSNVDMICPTITDEYGSKVELTNSTCLSFIENPNRNVRRNAFEAYYKSYYNLKNTYASLLDSNTKTNLIYSKIRNFETKLEETLYYENVPMEIYNSIIEIVGANTGLLHRYVALLKRINKLDKIYMYDLIPAETPKYKIPYELAVEIVKNSLKVFGERYCEDLVEIFNSGWIDVFENEGKRSGAYTWNCYARHPYILLNYTDNLSGVLTLSHEIGHAMHTYYSNNKQSYLYSQPHSIISEVSSTVNELLVLHYLLNNDNNKKEKKNILYHMINQFKTFVFRQVMLAEFEESIYEKVESGNTLTSDKLCSLYHNLNRKYYGAEIMLDMYTDIEWAKIPHLYLGFYTYKYALGFLIAVTLFQKIISNNKQVINAYITLLESGCSSSPEELLNLVTIDITSTTFIKTSLSAFESILSEVENAP